MGCFASADSFVVLATGVCCCVCRSLVSSLVRVTLSTEGLVSQTVQVTTVTKNVSLNVRQTSLNNVQRSSRTSTSACLFTNFLTSNLFTEFDAM